MLTGPAGVALTVGAAVAALTNHLLSNRRAARDAALGIDEYTRSLDRMTEAEAGEEIAGLATDIAVAENRLATLREGLDRGLAYTYDPTTRRHYDRAALEVEIRDQERLLDAYRARQDAAREVRDRLAAGLPPPPSNPPAPDPGSAAGSGAAEDPYADEIASIASRLDARRAATEEGMAEIHRREMFLIQTHYGERSAYALALEEEHQARLAQRRADADAAATAAEREAAEARAASGIPALHHLRAETARLAGVDEYSREAVERSNRARERQIEIAQAFRGASEGVRATLAREYKAQDAAAQLLETKIGLLERYNAAAVDQSADREAVEDLRRSGDFDDLQASAGFKLPGFAADGAFEGASGFARGGVIDAPAASGAGACPADGAD